MHTQVYPNNGANSQSTHACLDVVLPGWRGYQRRITRDHQHHETTCPRSLSQGLQDDLEQTSKAFVEENGALLKHESAQSLTNEVSLALDRDHLVSLNKQLGRIWSTVWAAKNRRTCVAGVQKLCMFIDEAMAKLSES